MNKYFYEMLMKAKKKILENPRTCEICGAKETLDNTMLAYDNGKIMCDDCAIAFYEEQDKKGDRE